MIQKIREDKKIALDDARARECTNIRRIERIRTPVRMEIKGFCFFSSSFLFFSFFFSSNENEQWTRFNERLDVVLEIVVGVLDADGPLNTRKLVSGTATIVHLAALESHSFPLPHTHSLSLSLSRSFALSLSPARSFARSLALFLSLSFFLSPSSNDRFRGFRRLSKENPRRKNAEYRDGDEKRSQPPWSEALRYSTREPF